MINSESVSRQNESNGTNEPIEKSVIELLRRIHSKIDRRTPFSVAWASNYYNRLNTKINLVYQDNEEYYYIHDYLYNTHGPTHTHFRFSIENVYKAYRGDYSRYKPNKKLGNRKLLWHGTKMSNIESILSNGLSTKPPSGVPQNGKMFGEGVYFADVSSKAAQYCHADDSHPYGILILAEVALGKHYYKTKSERVTRLPDGKDSVKGLGKYKPDKFETIRTKFGAQVPLGRLKYHDDLRTVLNYSEYIVYNEDQIFIQYLVLVRFYFVKDDSSEDDSPPPTKQTTNKECFLS